MRIARRLQHAQLRAIRKFQGMSRSGPLELEDHHAVDAEVERRPCKQSETIYKPLGQGYQQRRIDELGGATRKLRVQAAQSSYRSEFLEAEANNHEFSEVPNLRQPSAAQQNGRSENRIRNPVRAGPSIRDAHSKANQRAGHDDYHVIDQRPPHSPRWQAPRKRYCAECDPPAPMQQWKQRRARDLPPR